MGLLLMKKLSQGFIDFLGATLISLLITSFITIATLFINSLLSKGVSNQFFSTSPPWWVGGLPFRIFHYAFESRISITALLANIGFWSIIVYQFFFKIKLKSLIVLLTLIIYFLIPFLFALILRRFPLYL